MHFFSGITRFYTRFSDDFYSFPVVHWSTYSNTNLHAININFAKTDKNDHTQNTLHTVLKIQTEADLRFSSYKTVISLVSRKHVYMLYEPHGSTVYKTFCMENRCRVNNTFYWMHGSSVYNSFGMVNGCRVNNNFILDAMQPCI